MHNGENDNLNENRLVHLTVQDVSYEIGVVVRTTMNLASFFVGPIRDTIDNSINRIDFLVSSLFPNYEANTNINSSSNSNSNEAWIRNKLESKLSNFFGINISARHGLIQGLIDKGLLSILYDIFEALLIEIWDTLIDIIEYYDSDPKSNIILKIINNMSDIINAIRSLLALSDCYFENAIENDIAKYQTKPKCE